VVGVVMDTEVNPRSSPPLFCITARDLYTPVFSAILQCSTVVADIRQTRGDRILAITGDPSGYWPQPLRMMEIQRDGSCSLLCDFNLPRMDAVAYHPDYGFALLSVVNQSLLMLARVDTNGNEVQPSGFVHCTPTGRSIGAADVALSADGHVAMLWTERDDDVTTAGMLCATSVNWTTYLDADNPRPSVKPESFALSAYPNPFNSETRINYTLTATRMVDLSVYNVNGQQVATLHSGVTAAGNYTANWRPDCGSGIYFIRLQCGTTMRTVKTVYLR
jgi:hypothetical protein